MPLTRIAAVTKGALMTFLAPRLAMDANIDMNPLLRGLTSKNFSSKRNELLGGITNLVRDKLAKDAELDHLPELLEALEHDDEGEEVLDEEPMQTGASSATPNKAKEFLTGKLSSEDMATYDELCKDEEGEKPDFLKKKAEGEDDDPNAKSGAALKHEDDDLLKDEEEVEEKKEKGMDRKAMDAAIKSAITGEQRRQQAIREAEKAFRPFLGEIAMGFDSAEEVYRHGLKALGVKTKLTNIPLPALQAILESQPSSTSRRSEPREIAMDADAVASFQKRFPTAVQPKQL